MHWSKNEFVVSNGWVVFYFTYTLENDPLKRLGTKDKNQVPFMFLRACLSHKKMWVDPSILEIIPDLMNNKLP